MTNRKLNQRINLDNINDWPDQSFISQMPKEILNEIVFYLSLKDFLALSISCKSLYLFCNDLWHIKFKNDFSQSSITKKLEGNAYDWKYLYKAFYKQTNSINSNQIAKYNIILSIYCKQSDETILNLAQSRTFNADDTIQILEAGARFCDATMFEKLLTHIPTTRIYQQGISQIYYTAIIYNNMEVAQFIEIYNFAIGIRFNYCYKNTYDEMHPYSGLNLMQIACMMGDLDLVKNVLAHLARSSSQQDYIKYCRTILTYPEVGEPPIVIAAQHGHLNIIERLLESDFYKFSIERCLAAFEVARQFRQAAIVKKLCSIDIPNINEDFLKNVILTEASNDHYELTQVCKNHYETTYSKLPATMLDQLLSVAVANCNVKWIRELLSEGANINATIAGLPMLHHHIKNNLAMPMTLLLENGIDLNIEYNGYDAFEYATQLCAAEALRVLLPKLKEKPRNFNKLLLIAFGAVIKECSAPYSKHETIRLLLSAGANIEAYLSYSIFIWRPITILIEADVKDLSNPRQDNLPQQIFDYLTQLHKRRIQGEDTTSWFGYSTYDLFDAASTLMHVALKNKSTDFLKPIKNILTDTELKPLYQAYLNSLENNNNHQNTMSPLFIAILNNDNNLIPYMNNVDAHTTYQNQNPLEYAYRCENIIATRVLLTHGFHTFSQNKDHALEQDIVNFIIENNERVNEAGATPQSFCFFGLTLSCQKNSHPVRKRDAAECLLIAVLKLKKDPSNLSPLSTLKQYENEFTNVRLNALYLQCLALTNQKLEGARRNEDTSPQQGQKL